MEQMLGIDVGATGIKGGIVDLVKGELLSEKIKYKTPHPAKPKNVMKVMHQLIKDMEWEGKPFACGFPAVIKNGVSKTATNIDKSWIDYNIEKEFSEEFGVDVTCINDADAAGLAEITFGKGIGEKGTVVMLTLGTGIGSGLFLNGQLVPNSEFGLLHYKKSIAEKYAANSARLKKDLSWKEWGKELNNVLEYIEDIITPDLIILGGGVSKHFHEYDQYFKLDTPVIQAKLLNNAGIIGSAVYAAQKQNVSL